MRFFEKAFFFLLLASIPIQLGKHFWLPFSFVQGIRVDYLSPTIYLSDVFVVLLFLVSISRLIHRILLFIKQPLVVIAVLSLFFSTLFAESVPASVFGIIKFLEFVYVGFYVVETFNKKEWDKYLFVFTLGALVETIILIFQFISQSSLGGVFYFLGERTFNASTPGISLFQMGGQMLLRPYGTFPHPNVLALYLFVGFVLLFATKFSSRILIFLKSIALLFIALGIILTFSRVIILLLTVSVMFYLFKKTKALTKNKKRIVISIVLVVLCFLVVLLFPRFESSFVRDSLSRLNLVSISFDIFRKHPIFGVGLNNFFIHEISYQKNISPTLLQPVHNIYFLWIVQTGIIGSVVLFMFLKKLYNQFVFHLKKKGSFALSFSVIVLVFSVCSIGIFDHYLLTLQQGQLLLSFILGLTFTREKN